MSGEGVRPALTAEEWRAGKVFFRTPKGKRDEGYVRLRWPWRRPAEPPPPAWSYGDFLTEIEARKAEMRASLYPEGSGERVFLEGYARSMREKIGAP